MILRPETLEHDDLVQMSISKNEIRCGTKFYNASFHQLARKYDFEWSGDHKKWRKFSASAHTEDRAAEFGYMILLEGFSLSLDHQEVFRRIKENDFEYEPIRVIDICDFQGYENYLRVSWKRNDLYSCVRHNLYGSKYLKKYSAIVVPLYFHQEIYDFAEDYEFLITERAKNSIEEGKKDIFKLFNLKRPEKKKETVFHTPPKLKHEKNEIEDSLKNSAL